MITDYCTVICFVMIGLNLIMIYSKLKEMDRLYNSWRAHTLQHDKVFTDIEWHRADDLGKLADTNRRIQALEERLEAHAAELTEHHNRIDTLEINEGIFERVPDLEDKIKALEGTVEYLEGKL